jgi:hypothetical protein
MPIHAKRIGVGHKGCKRAGRVLRHRTIDYPRRPGDRVGIDNVGRNAAEHVEIAHGDGNDAYPQYD